MNHENISLQDLLDRQAELCKQIKNCKISKKQIFENKSILELLKKLINLFRTA